VGDTNATAVFTQTDGTIFYDFNTAPPAGKPYPMPWQVDTTGGVRNGIILNNNYLTNTTNLADVTTDYGIIRFNDLHENNEISFDFLFIGAASDQEISVSMRNISFEDYAFVTFKPGGIRMVDKHLSATVANGFPAEGFYLDEFTPVTHWNATWYETYIRTFGSTLSVWVRPRTASPTLTSWVASTAPTYTQELNPISVAPYKSNTAVRLHIRVRNSSGGYAANSARIDNFRLKTYTNDYYPVSIPDTVLKAKIKTDLFEKDIITEGTNDLFSNHLNAAGFTSFAATNPASPPPADQIQNLAGLEHARGLTSLELSRQNILDLTPLVHMRSLQTLKVWSNPIEDFTVLPLLRNLRTAVLGDTDAEGAEWGPIAECTGLTELRVSDTPGFENTALASVGPLTQLTTFYAHRTPITSLAGVGFNTKPLNNLAINETGVSDLADLVTNTNFTGATDQLEVLDCPLGAAAHCTQIPTLKAAPRSITVLHESASCRTLTLTTLGAGTITASTPGPYLDGDTVTLTAQAGNGYIFHRWNVNDGESFLYELSPTLTVSADTSIRAEFLNGGYFTIQTAVNPAGNGSAVSISPQAQIYTPDDVITLTAGPIASHAFTHWSGDEDFLYGGEEFTLNSFGLGASFPNLVASIQQGGTPQLNLTANYVPALVYRPGCDLVLRVQVDKYVAGTVNAMGVSLDLGSWRFLGLVPGPNTPALYPQTGDTGMLEFIWLDNTVINTEAYLEFEIVVNVPWSAPEEFTIIGESECRTSEGMKRSSTYLYLT
ncbi:MAG: hypothetical protein HYV27_03550, partial [Candidatus Hydrogenedentes bacterium]|nr:hypothetical protein [Candidatus Hydrogenedentota bacterium]